MQYAVFVRTDVPYHLDQQITADKKQCRKIEITKNTTSTENK
jgi:hypothetical protein